MSVKAAGLEWRNRVQQDGANKDSWGWHLLLLTGSDLEKLHTTIVIPSCSLPSFKTEHN
jgi:hypothetical protein